VQYALYGQMPQQNQLVLAALKTKEEAYLVSVAL